MYKVITSPPHDSDTPHKPMAENTTTITITLKNVLILLRGIAMCSMVTNRPYMEFHNTQCIVNDYYPE